jgi:hypothetical protein
MYVLTGQCANNYGMTVKENSPNLYIFLTTGLSLANFRISIAI